jgi:hypothetical protein
MRTAFKMSNRAYTVLLVFYPCELRERFAGEMTDVFDQQIEAAWDESGFAGLARVWLWAIRELVFVALPAQLGQPIVLVPTLSLISNSAMFLVLLRALSPLAEMCRIYGHPR